MGVWVSVGVYVSVDEPTGMSALLGKITGESKESSKGRRTKKAAKKEAGAADDDEEEEEGKVTSSKRARGKAAKKKTAAPKKETKTTEKKVPLVSLDGTIGCVSDCNSSSFICRSFICSFVSLSESRAGFSGSGAVWFSLLRVCLLW